VGVLGWPLAVARLLAALLLSLGAGYLTLLISRSGFLGNVLRENVVGGERTTKQVGGRCSPEGVSVRPAFVGVSVAGRAAGTIAAPTAASLDFGVVVFPYFRKRF
jgi:hypothetical protein